MKLGPKTPRHAPRSHGRPLARLERRRGWARWPQPETYCNNYNRRSTLSLMKEHYESSHVAQLLATPRALRLHRAGAAGFAVFAQGNQPSTVIKPPPASHAGAFAGCRAACGTRLRPARHGVVAEEIVARVNNDIITLSGLRKSGSQALQPRCHGRMPGSVRPERVEAMYRDKQKDSAARLDRPATPDPARQGRGHQRRRRDVIKRLDDVRKQNGLASARRAGKGRRKRGPLLGRVQVRSSAMAC